MLNCTHIFWGGLIANVVLNTISIKILCMPMVMYSLENSLVTMMFCPVNIELFNHFSMFRWLCCFLLFAVKKIPCNILICMAVS